MYTSDIGQLRVKRSVGFLEEWIQSKNLDLSRADRSVIRREYIIPRLEKGVSTGAAAIRALQEYCGNYNLSLPFSSRELIDLFSCVYPMPKSSSTQ